MLLACWAHVRRKFEAALAKDKRLANEALEYIGLLYTIEANLKDKNLSFDQITAERKHHLFCGNDEAAKDTVLFYSFLGSCKDIGVNPAQWLADVLDNIKDCKVSELHQFFPYNWKENRNKI